MLDRPESVRTRETDLASMILAAPPRLVRSYDARSALLLALVVGVLALVLAAILGLRARGDATPHVSPSSSNKHASQVAGGAAGAAKPAAAEARRSSSTAPDPADGISLAIGRMTATAVAASGQMVVRIGVSNLGRDALPAAPAAQLVLLVDDQVVGRQTLRPLAGSGARATYAFTLPSCSSGRHAVTAIADATSTVRDAAGSNGARSRELAFDCPFG